MGKMLDPTKAQPRVGLILTVLAVLLGAGLLTFAGPCAAQAGEEASSCLWASRALIGVDAVLLIIALVRIFEQDEGERRGLSFASALLGVLIAVMPGTLIALCADPSAPCNAVMRPFALVVGVAVALTGGIDLTRRLLALRKR
ncbi:MAG: DUF4418 family protein [Coriobacteriaceae bacterium]|nr:DUF4418 family protein [Coriobacteriaceae bacterium]